jgi:phage terminase large subunit GpA-like protein
VAVGIAKLEFYNNLRKSADVGEDGLTTVFPAGFVHLPKIDAEFIQQLCAEQLITRRDRNGFPVREWQKMRERNEALDCYVYARAAASAAGLDRFEERHWRELERQLGWPVRHPLKHQPNRSTRPPNAVASLFLATATPVGA